MTTERRQYTAAQTIKSDQKPQDLSITLQYTLAEMIATTFDTMIAKGWTPDLETLHITARIEENDAGEPHPFITARLAAQATKPITQE